MKLTEKLKLTRPLAIFDIESTGLNPRADRIVELSVVRVEVDGSTTVKTWLVNPEMPIPPEVSAIHHITDSDVKNCLPFSMIVDEVDTLIAGCDLGGYNVLHFDIPMLEEEFIRCGRSLDTEMRHVIDAQKIFHKREPRDLSAAVRLFCGREHEGAHGAEADTLATLDVIIGQFERYGDLPDSIEEIEREYNNLDPANVDRTGRFRWENGEVIINFGKKKGSKLREFIKTSEGTSFLKWMLKSDFPIDARRIAQDALDGILPKPPKSGQ